MNYYIVENSPLAFIAKCFMRTRAVAMVIGKGIHLSGVSEKDFLKDALWLRHELVHIEQYKKYGTIRFLIMYLIESIRRGYYQNKFEVEARTKSRADQ